MPSTRVAPTAQFGSSISSKSDIKDKDKEKEPPKNDEGSFSILDDKNFLEMINQSRSSGAGPALKT